MSIGAMKNTLHLLGIHVSAMHLNSASALSTIRFARRELAGMFSCKCLTSSVPEIRNHEWLLRQ